LKGAYLVCRHNWDATRNFSGSTEQDEFLTIRPVDTQKASGICVWLVGNILKYVAEKLINVGKLTDFIPCVIFIAWHIPHIHHKSAVHFKRNAHSESPPAPVLFFINVDHLRLAVAGNQSLGKF